MEVEDKRPFFALVDGRQPPMREPVWQKPEISAPRYGQSEAKRLCRGQRPLHDGFSVRCGHSIWRPVRVRDAVPIMPYRKNAGVICKAELGDDVQGPKGFAHDGITCRAITEYRESSDVLEQIFGVQRLLAKILRRL